MDNQHINEENHKNFDKLVFNKDILKGLYLNGFNAPSSIQIRGINAINTNRDCIIQSQSGTGKTATSAQAQEMHSYIRSLIASKYNNEIAQEISILYGGSCNASNAKELFACEDVDGGLIGGAALKADTFLPIIEAMF